MATFPTSQIGGYDISRLIIGSNTFHGFSHFSKARSDWLRKHFTPERIFEVMCACARQGLNATVSMQRPDYAEVLRAVEAETGVHIHWFATPGGGDLEQLKDGICEAAELGAEFCLPHTMWTDARLMPARGIIEEAEEAIDFIKSKGMKAGWSTHRPECVTVSDRAGYVGEAGGLWLWVVVWPVDEWMVVHDDLHLVDVRDPANRAHLAELPTAALSPRLAG